MTAVLQEIITLLTSGLSQMAQGIGSGFNAFMSAIFLETSGNTTALSVTGGIIVVFAAIALSIGLGRLVANYLFGLGK